MSKTDSPHSPTNRDELKFQRKSELMEDIANMVGFEYDPARQVSSSHTTPASFKKHQLAAILTTLRGEPLGEDEELPARRTMVKEIAELAGAEQKPATRLNRGSVEAVYREAERSLSQRRSFVGGADHSERATSAQRAQVACDEAVDAAIEDTLGVRAVEPPFDIEISVDVEIREVADET